MINIAEHAKRIGQTATLRTKEFQVEVRVVDFGFAYGCLRYVVEPVSGSGSATVDAGRLTFAEAAA